MAKIMLVDDDVSFRKMLRLTLERVGHDVTAAENGTDALSLADKTAFDLVITDIIMPDVEGLEVIMTLKQRNADIKIIAMSGGARMTPTSYLGMAQKFGAMQALAKPFSEKQLFSAIEELLGKPSGDGRS